MKIYRTMCLAALLLACLSAPAWSAPAQPLKLVDDGKSVYSIFHEPDAAASVKDAARELQTYIAKASGAKLGIVTKFPSTPVICLGMNDQAKANGLTLDGVKTEGYRIVTKGQNIFILGEDTPDKARTAKDGFSRGTQNGAYTFLETFFGIRWLMPGEAGEYVPHADTVEIPPTSLTDGPDFIDRRLGVGPPKDPKVIEWSIRNKVGSSIRWMHGHNWDCCTAGVYQDHPEIFTLKNGERRRPLGGSAWLCTSNPETIRFMGLRQIGFFRQYPGAFMQSITPTDGLGAWCECESCTALDEKLPNGEVLHTRRMVTFYNKVTEYLVQKCPDKTLGGLVYVDYIDPPLDTTFRFHPNFYPVFDPAFYYGVSGYRKETRERFQKLIDGWAPLGEGRMCFYGIPFLIQGNGRFVVPVPPGREFLKTIFAPLKKANFAGVRLDGMSGWGAAGVSNWVAARLMWKADTDVDALCDEYYAKCYGKGGPAMSQLYGLIESQMEKYVVADPKATYHLSPKALKAVYLPVYSKLEEFYKQADAAVDTPETRKRLEYFGWNMRGLYRVLEDYGWLMNAKDSRFYMSEPEFTKWVMTEKDSIYISPGSVAASGPLAAMQGNILKTPISVKAFHDALPNAEPLKPFVIRFKNHLVLLSEKAGEVRLSITGREGAKAPEVGYKVYDQNGNVVTSGQGAEEKEVTFLGTEGGIYHMFLESQMIYVKVTGASWAIDTRYFDFMRLGQANLVLAQVMSPLYFHVPQGTAKFSLAMSTAAPGETCAAALYDPQNKLVAEADTVKTGNVTFSNEGGGGAWWKLVIGKANAGALDKVYLQLEGIPNYVCPDPANRLVIEKLNK